LIDTEPCILPTSSRTEEGTATATPVADFVTRLNNKTFEAGDYDPVTNPFGKRPDQRTPQGAEAARKRLSLGSGGTPSQSGPAAAAEKPSDGAQPDTFKATLDMMDKVIKTVRSAHHLLQAIKRLV